MLSGISSSVMGSVIESKKVDLISNNLANVNTIGFKKDFLSFMTLPSPIDRPVGSGYDRVSPQDDIRSAPLGYKSYLDTQVGPLQQTGEKLDVAIEGEGYFRVRLNDKILYTRAGNFELNSAGRVVMPDTGAELLNTNNEPIVISNPSEINISEDGTIENLEGEIGTIAYDNFANPENFKKIGNSLFEVSDDQSPLPPNGKLIQGFLESSTVNMLEELNELILAHRTYQANMRMVSLQDDTLDRLINGVASIS